MRRSPSSSPLFKKSVWGVGSVIVECRECGLCLCVDDTGQRKPVAERALLCGLGEAGRLMSAWAHSQRRDYLLQRGRHGQRDAQAMQRIARRSVSSET